MLKEAGRLTDEEYKSIIRDNNDFNKFCMISKHYESNSDYYEDEILKRFPLEEQLELRYIRGQIECMAEDYNKYRLNPFKVVAGIYKKRVVEIVQLFIDKGVIDYKDADKVLSWYLKYYYRMGYFGKYMPFDLSSLVHDRKESV